MPVVITGGRPYSFKPEGEAQTRTGYTLFALDDIAQGKGVGREAFKFSLNMEQFGECITANGGLDAVIGRAVALSYNRWGKVDGLTVLAEKK